jgi:hypothetical protein
MKYNNLYDKLRKKKDELKILLLQREYIIHQQEVKNCLSFKVNKLIVETLSVDDELDNLMTHCQKVCLKDPDIYEQIEDMLYP